MKNTAHLQLNLIGESIQLRPLQATDFEELYAVAADPLIWQQHPEPTRYQRAVFEIFFASAIEGGTAFVVIDNTNGKIIGSSRYYEWSEQENAVAIGYTFLARAYWGGDTNREMKHLMLEHIFQTVDRVWFHIGKDNLRSRKALEKIGGEFSHVETNNVGDLVRETAFYKIDKAKYSCTLRQRTSITQAT